MKKAYGVLLAVIVLVAIVMSVDPMGGKHRSTDVAGASARTSSCN